MQLRTHAGGAVDEAGEYVGRLTKVPKGTDKPGE